MLAIAKVNNKNQKNDGMLYLFLNLNTCILI